MVGLDSSAPVGGRDGLPDLENLLRVARGMGGNHDESLLAGDGTGEERMVRGPAARVFSEAVDVLDGLGAHGIEGSKGLAQARVFVGFAGLLIASLLLVMLVPEHRGRW